MIDRVLYIPGGAGFLPSTVWKYLEPNSKDELIIPEFNIYLDEILSLHESTSLQI